MYWQLNIHCASSILVLKRVQVSNHTNRLGVLLHSFYIEILFVSRKGMTVFMSELRRSNEGENELPDSYSQFYCDSL